MSLKFMRKWGSILIGRSICFFVLIGLSLAALNGLFLLITGSNTLANIESRVEVFGLMLATSVTLSILLSLKRDEHTSGKRGGLEDVSEEALQSYLYEGTFDKFGSFGPIIKGLVELVIVPLVSEFSGFHRILYFTTDIRLKSFIENEMRSSRLTLTKGVVSDLFIDLKSETTEVKDITKLLDVELISILYAETDYKRMCHFIVDGNRGGVHIVAFKGTFMRRFPQKFFKFIDKHLEKRKIFMIEGMGNKTAIDSLKVRLSINVEQARMDELIRET